MGGDHVTVDAAVAPAFDGWTRDYAMLGLRLDRLVPGTVDSWIGPRSWWEDVAREEMPVAASLLADADSLLDRLPRMNYWAARQAYLERQVTAMRTIVRLARGEVIPLAEQAALLFDIRPQRVPESIFEASHDELDRLLPGTGSLPDRMIVWTHSHDIPTDRLGWALERAMAEVRDRTRRHLDLPAGEDIELGLVRNQPWSAYNWYLGHARSRIEFNTDLPVRATDLVLQVAHEGYPGHHTEHAIREMRQFREGGQGEYSIQLINTPENVISEAIAVSARELIFADGEDLEWLASSVLPELGLTMDVDRAARIREARKNLQLVWDNTAFLLHEDGLPAEDVVAYMERWALVPRLQAEKRLEFIQSDLWGAYTFTYTYGRALLAPLLRGDDAFAVYGRVLTEPVYPALLALWREEGAGGEISTGGIFA